MARERGGNVFATDERYATSLPPYSRLRRSRTVASCHFRSLLSAGSASTTAS